METLKILSPIMSKACLMEESDPQSKGEFVRTLCVCADFEEDLIESLFDQCVDALVESDLLTSCEFHEGLQGVLPAHRMVDLLVRVYSQISTEKLGEAVSMLSSSGSLRLDRDSWAVLRANMLPTEYRGMLVHHVEMGCDRIGHVSDLLRKVFDTDEEFEISETLRVLFERDWILDILPQKRRAARRVLMDEFLVPFPFAEKVISDFCSDVLQLEIADAKPSAATAPDGEPEKGSSSDSDIESRGSLDDFVVDSEDDEESGSDSESSDSESEFESSADERRKRKSSKTKLQQKHQSSANGKKTLVHLNKAKRMRERSESSSCSASSSGSSSSGYRK